MSHAAKLIRNLQYVACEASLRVPVKAAVEVTEYGPEIDLVVSLTSYPPRIGMLWKTLETIFRQSITPSAVVLALSAEEFPGRRLPSSITRYIDRGLRISFVDRNIRSYKKLIPAMLEFPEKIIVTADDDVLYPRHWLRELVAAHRTMPAHIVGHRGTVIQVVEENVQPYVTWPQADMRSAPHRVFLTGLGGILYPPHALLDYPTLDMDLAMRLAPTADDIWFKAMSLLANTPVSKVSDGNGDFLTVRSLQKFSLRSTNVLAGRNDVQFRAVIDYFGLWRRLVSGTA
ncbi:hypothetical protein [Arthrobacter sp. zg-Y769]|uniref:hypothetical protein n=1 Tax=Arthrobacter sp. zg-Y769 TaxID=2894191 RepID=UPI001E417EAB|nr:hypothetical protein [Arthrobacter sp. zg-Y769]MCC9205439.1 hypothetical protein [Arthrobacter sp. zg-Y769]